MESIWSKTSHIQEYPTLQGDLKADVAIIGGGLSGILTAFLLKEKNIDAVVLESAKIGSGQTQNTTAKITSQHALIYSKLRKDFGDEKARQYAHANQKAIEEYKRIIQKLTIDCSFTEAPAYLYSKDQHDIDILEKETHDAKDLAINAEFTANTELPFDVAAAVKFHEQAQFHPLLFLKAIAKDLTIFENTRVLSVEDNRITTDKGTVTAKHIVFASHFPFINMPGYYFARMHQERSYVIGLENAQKMNGMYIGIDKDALSFRSYGDLLIFGGGGHRTGENSMGGKYDFLRKKADEYYPQHKEICFWSAQDCMTLDGVPYIGQYCASTPNWYVATGYGKWGMTTSMVAAAIISDKISGKENPDSEVFSPLRFVPSASMKNLATDLGQSVKGLTRRIFSGPRGDVDELPLGHGGVVEYEDEKVGVYKIDSGKIFAVSVKCPHLGCQLEWNPDEKTWDCPCHGSRFDYKGKLIDDPAQTDLECTEN